MYGRYSYMLMSDGCLMVELVRIRLHPVTDSIVRPRRGLGRNVAFGSNARKRLTAQLKYYGQIC